MLWRRPLRHQPRLDRLNLSPLSSAPLLDPPIRCRPAAVGRRRYLASVSHPAPWASSPRLPQQEGQGRGNGNKGTSGIPPTLLDDLLQAIQCHESHQVVPRFLAWVDSFELGNDEVREAAREELQQLPTSTFSEILRCIDPVANPKHDIAHGLNLDLGQAQHTNASRLVDEYGVRIQHRAILEAVKVLYQGRLDGSRPLLIPDYEILLRCAGAAADVEAAMFFFGAISRNGLGNRRTTTTWVEFLKARFLIEPIYYQWNRARVAVIARQNYSNRNKRLHKAAWDMERIRLSLSALLPMPFNRMPGDESKDMRMWLRRRKGAKSYKEHWTRSKLYGVLVNEELLCASMIAFARSSSYVSFKSIVLWHGFRLRIREDTKTGEVIVKGGKNFRPGSPREPTARLLYAIVESFGSMSRIPAALKLMVFVSHRYQIPIPHETWSNLLQWAYMCAAKPLQSMRKQEGDFSVNRVTPSHICEIWKIMTSEPYNVIPTIDDYNCYVKALIEQRRLKAAMDIIRQAVIPYYRSLEDQHHKIVEEDLMQDFWEPSDRRLQIEAQKEYTYNHITVMLQKVLGVASENKLQRNGPFMQTVVPDLISEFGDFLPEQVAYRTAQGRVRIERPNVVKRFDFVMETRMTLPQKIGGMMMMKSLRKRNQDTWDHDEWPEVPQMRVKTWRRVPRPRVRAEGRPPAAGDVRARTYWKALEEELMT
ncbi:Fc.00g002000.m01.CDS01 [Cosmosporella sp. VM-42]